MKLTNEQLAKAKAAQSAEEILELAKAEGIEITADDAKRVFTLTHEPPAAELSDDELENVAGGSLYGFSDDFDYCYKSCDVPYYQIGDHVSHAGRTATVVMISEPSRVLEAYPQYLYFLEYDVKKPTVQGHAYESELKFLWRA